MSLNQLLEFALVYATPPTNRVMLLQYRLGFMSEGEPFFFALFLLFAILVILGIAENLDLLPRLHGGYIIYSLKI